MKFEEPTSFGQGGNGTRCRVCQADTYSTAAVEHRWWCPARWLRRLR